MITDEELARAYQRETETARRQDLADSFVGNYPRHNPQNWVLTKDFLIDPIADLRSVDIWLQRFKSKLRYRSPRIEASYLWHTIYLDSRVMATDESED